ncbi:HepT-like ribonuclease domain-containing protein [Flavobacterium limnophilum]|uniref:HepT-like ribonuclease domain-containing protein n=1 Tax=Flavobacterium limnophilum TaxID=3003262 RepID=UPI0022ABCBD0|nr:HepT-like ribonuclease domain-containing protein [Flavobacterium limnophilum]
MTEKSKKYLSDVLMAIDLINEFTIGISDFNLYDKDRKTQSAVERQLVIIGEALNKLRQIEPQIIIENDHQIIGFRNRLVHAYDSIDNSIVWAIINRHLEKLRLEIENFQNE